MARSHGVLRLIDTPSGEAFDAEYLGETPEGFGFSVKGTEIVIPHDDVASGLISFDGLSPSTEGSNDPADTMVSKGGAAPAAPESTAAGQPRFVMPPSR